MNPIIMCCFNNLDLTKKAVESAMAQTIPVHLTVVNNGSTDGTGQWLSDLAALCPNVTVIHNETNVSPVKVANCLMPRLFAHYPYLLCIPNDCVLPPNAYTEMLRWPRGFVCASTIGDAMPTVYESIAVSECTPMAVMLVRKWAYDALIARDGYFLDEGYFHYASDCDLAVRMATCGIRGVQLNVPYSHVGSATHNLPEIHAESCVRADRDRTYFEQKWGFKVSSPEYGKVANDPNFK